MDKITRILLLYSKLIRGEPVNKAVFCVETESKDRSFDRDIEDVRLFLSEIFSIDEVIYDRTNNYYYLSGAKRKELEMTEYRFLERLLLQSGMLRKDEMEGVLYTLASNTARSKECARSIREKMTAYENVPSAPLLKMHEDISHMIIEKRAIRIKYHDKVNAVHEYEIIPFDIEFADGSMRLLSMQNDGEALSPKYYMVDRIESFTPSSRVSGEEWNRIENSIIKYRKGKGGTKSRKE